MSAVAIIFIIIFASKLLNYSSRNKKAKRALEETRQLSVCSLAGILTSEVCCLGLSNMVYSIIAFALLAIMVVLFVLMMIMRGKCLKSEEQAEDAKDEDMKMMLMRMMSGNGAQGRVYERSVGHRRRRGVRGIVADTVTALLPVCNNSCLSKPRPTTKSCKTH